VKNPKRGEREKNLLQRRLKKGVTKSKTESTEKGVLILENLRIDRGGCRRRGERAKQ